MIFTGTGSFRTIFLEMKGRAGGFEGMEDTDGVRGSSVSAENRGLFELHLEGPGEHADEYPDELKFDSDVACEPTVPKNGLRNFEEQLVEILLRAGDSGSESIVMIV